MTPLDAFGLHGAGGFSGAVLTGLLSQQHHRHHDDEHECHWHRAGDQERAEDTFNTILARSKARPDAIPFNTLINA
jgi:ammonia channel protein AmtB